MNSISYLITCLHDDFQIESARIISYHQIVAQLLKSLWDHHSLLNGNIISSHARWHPDWPHRLWLYSFTVLRWVAVAAVVRIWARRFSDISAPALILASAGWGTLFVLVTSRLGMPLGPHATSLLMSLPMMTVFLIAALDLIRGQKQKLSAPESPVFLPQTAPRKGLSKLTLAVSILVLIFFAIVVTDRFLWLPLLKSEAQGDEVYYWWSATRSLHDLGWTAYIKTFWPSSYFPAYPLISDLVLFGVSGNSTDNAGLALPFLWGLFCIWTLCDRLVSLGKKAPIETWALYAFYVCLLFFCSFFIREMLFSLWYGEGLAILCIVNLFLSVFEARGQTGNRLLLAFQLVGIGALSSIGKPPLALLLLSCVAPCIVLFAFTREKIDRNPILKNTLLLVAGGLVTSLLFAHAVKLTGQEPLYSASLPELLKFKWSAISQTLVPFFFGTYKLVWLVFLATAFWAIRFRPRHFIGPLSVAAGLALSIFIIYGSVWKHIEYGSGLRYLLHGMYGWTIYFLIVMTDWTNEKIRALR